jgi:hypothetical protein
MTYSYYVGVDLAMSQDYTAVAVLEEPAWVPEIDAPSWGWDLNIKARGWVSPQALSPYQLEQALAFNLEYGRAPDPPLSVRHLERFQARYAVVAERVGRILRSGALRGKRVALVVDATGVGRGVVDLFRQSGLSPVPITITGGTSMGQDPDGGFRVPKRDLIGSAQVSLQNGQLRIAEGLALSEVLKKELENFRLKINVATGHDSYEAWREGDHDDLVLSTSLATWYRAFWNEHLDLACAGVATETAGGIWDPGDTRVKE